ncbi:fimbrillin family protein [Rikenella microfusus]|uniref:fimbrillin family protein n=1 Tax=Rikenella microfusus TaxID=28139 RepID=UPI00248DBC04|nr:fimbrillin family protein [Rikenella microfusus]
MNRIILPIMALAALTGCSKNGAHTANTDDRVPVRLGAGVEVQAKAPVNTGMSFEAAVAAWETSAPTVDYGAATAWRQTVTITADPTAAQTVVLDPARYYRPDPAVRTYIHAWYPAGTWNGDGTVSIDAQGGETDPMIAPQVSGSSKDNGEKNLAFSHPTTQIKFMVAAGEGLAAGTRIEGITIKDAVLPTGFDLNAGSVTYAASAADLPVPGLVAAEIGTAAPAGHPVMIRPIDRSFFFVDVAVSGYVFRDVRVDVAAPDTRFEAGKAYTITLTVRQREISLKATTAEWDYKGGGGAVLE